MAATLTVDTSGRICAWSRDAEELLGYSEAEAIGQSIELIIPPQLRGRHDAGFGRFVKKYPHLKDRVTDVLIGDLFKDDVDVLWPLIDQMRAENAVSDASEKRPDASPKRR